MYPSSTLEPLILVVDDVPAIVEELTDMLSLMDLPASGADSIDAALDLLAANPGIRLVVSDVRLPRESGFQLVRRAGDDPRLAGRALRYIFMTGHLDLTDVADARHDGILLAKPVNPRHLIEKIRESLGETG